MHIHTFNLLKEREWTELSPNAIPFKQHEHLHIYVYMYTYIYKYVYVWGRLG